MNISDIWDKSVRLVKIAGAGETRVVNVNVPGISTDWEWINQAGHCFRIPTYKSEDELLETIGIHKGDNAICIDRHFSVAAYRTCGIREICTVFLFASDRKYKIAEYVYDCAQSVYWLTRLWRLSIGVFDTVIHGKRGTFNCKRMGINSTQLMDLVFHGYRNISESTRGMDLRWRTINARIPVRYYEGVKRFKRFLPQTKIVVSIMIMRGEALSKVPEGKLEDRVTVEDELFKLWCRGKRLANGSWYGSHL